MFYMAVLTVAIVIRTVKDTQGFTYYVTINDDMLHKCCRFNCYFMFYCQFFFMKFYATDTIT